MNSRVAAMVLAVVLPYTIVTLTPDVSSVMRTVKYGAGLIVYIFLCFIKLEISDALITLIVPSLLIAVIILFFGSDILAFLKRNPEATKDGGTTPAGMRSA